MRKILYWLPVFLWMGVIFALSAQPSLKASAIDWQDLIIRKCAHITEYFILVLLIAKALSRTFTAFRRRILVIAFLLSLLYAASDEYHQTFVPGREGRSRDVFIDTIGISAGVYLLHRLSSL